MCIRDRYECLNYANYGIQEALLFRLAWMNTHKEDKAIEIDINNKKVPITIAWGYDGNV